MMTQAKFIVIGLTGLAAVGLWAVWQDEPAVKKETAVVNGTVSGGVEHRDSPAAPFSGGDYRSPEMPFVGDPHQPRITQEEYDTLLQRPLAELWDEWPRMLAELDGGDLASYVAAVGHNLHRSGQPSDYAWIESQLRDSSLPLETRMAYAYLLEESATPEATRILLDYLAWPQHEPALAESALQSVGKISYTLIDGSRNVSVSPVLEETWSNSTSEMPPQALAVLASSIAYLGTPDGVSALIGAVQEAPADALPDQRAATALNAIAEISGPDAVVPLTKALSEPPSTDLFWSSAVGLLTIGNADAYWAVIPRLQTVRQISDEDFEAISYAVTGRRGISPEAEKVLLDLTRTQGFADARLGELFSTPRE